MDLKLMKNWEYAVVANPDRQLLDSLGRSGWELVNVRTTFSFLTLFGSEAFLKRPVSSETDEKITSSEELIKIRESVDVLIGICKQAVSSNDENKVNFCRSISDILENKAIDCDEMAMTTEDSSRRYQLLNMFFILNTFGNALRAAANTIGNHK